MLEKSSVIMIANSDPVIPSSVTLPMFCCLFPPVSSAGRNGYLSPSRVGGGKAARKRWAPRKVCPSKSEGYTTSFSNGYSYRTLIHYVGVLYTRLKGQAHIRHPVSPVERWNPSCLSLMPGTCTVTYVFRALYPSTGFISSFFFSPTSFFV